MKITLSKVLNLRRCPVILLCMTGCADQPVTLEANDPGLMIRQDSLFLDHRPFTGQVIARYASKDTAIFSQWRNGVEHGIHQQWYADGQIKEERHYTNGRKTGIHRGWYPAGQRSFVYAFSNGEHHGIAEEWYPNGQPYRTFQYEHGHEAGLQRMWQEDGTLRANYAVRNGRRYGLIGLKLCRNPSDSLHP